MLVVPPVEFERGDVLVVPLVPVVAFRSSHPAAPSRAQARATIHSADLLMLIWLPFLWYETLSGEGKRAISLR